MNILLFLLLIQGSILSLLLYTRKYNASQNRWLGSFIVVILVISTIELVGNSGAENYGIWIAPFVSCKLLAPVLLYSYIASIGIKKNKHTYVHLILPILIGCIISLWFVFTTDIISFDELTNSKYDVLLTAINTVFWIIYLFKSFTSLHRAKKEQKISSQTQSLLKILFIAIFVSISLEIFDDINERFAFFPSLDFFDIVDLLFLGLIYFISYKALSQPQMFQDVNKLLPKPEKLVKYAGSNLSDNKLEGIQIKLEALMLTEKPYLKGDLSINELADKLQVSRQYITQVINEKMNCNFNDYINTFRVEEFKVRAKDIKYKNYTLLALALDSGFNSKTSFNTIFKKQTGMTPSQFRKSLDN